MKKGKFETMTEIHQKVEHRQKLLQQRIFIMCMLATLLILMLIMGLLE